MRTYTFRDGTVIPEGATLAATQSATHHDPSCYPDADKFDGFRFYHHRVDPTGAKEGGELAEETTESDWRNRLTGTSLEYLAFGRGRHVWSVPMRL